MIRILFLSSNLSSFLSFTKEASEITASIRTSAARDKFSLIQAHISSIADLQKNLLRTKPDIVHFSSRDNRVDTTIFEDINGNSQIVTTKAISMIFQVMGKDITCVVLNGNVSKGQADAIAKYVKCVIGLPNELSLDSSIIFASYFYQAVGYGKSIKEAFDLASLSLKLNSSEEVKPYIITTSEKDVSEITLIKDAEPLLIGSDSTSDDTQKNNIQQKISTIKTEYDQVLNGKLSVTDFYSKQAPVIRGLLSDRQSLDSIGANDASSLNLLLINLSRDISLMKTLVKSRNEKATFLQQSILRSLSSIVDKLVKIYR